MRRLQSLRARVPCARLHHDGGNPHRPAADVLETKNEPHNLTSVLQCDFYEVRRLAAAFVNTAASS